MERKAWYATTWRMMWILRTPVSAGPSVGSVGPVEEELACGLLVGLVDEGSDDGGGPSKDGSRIESGRAEVETEADGREWGGRQ